MAKKRKSDKSFVPEPLEDFACQIERCTFLANDVKNLLSHYRKVHNGDSEFQSSCLYTKNCWYDDKFFSFSNLYRHLQWYHPEFFQKQDSPSTSKITDTGKQDVGLAFYRLL